MIHKFRQQHSHKASTRHARGNRNLRRVGCGRRHAGSTMVEFAIVGTVLFVPMMMGIMEFGVLVKNNLLVANAVREGARAAATGKTPLEINNRVRTFIAPMSIGASPATADDCASFDQGTNCIRREWSTDSGGTYQHLTGTTNVSTQGSLVRVTVRTRHRPLTNFFWFMNNRTIATTVTMRRE